MTEPFWDDSIVVEKFAITRGKNFMTMDEAMVLSREIARRVSALSDKIEVVIGIGGGALLISKIISSKLRIPMETIWIQRKGSRIKETLSRIPWLVTLISKWYHIPGLNIPLKCIMSWFSSLARVSGQSTPIVHRKHILLVDDVIETGQTLTMAKKILSAGGPHSINTAVLVWANHSDLNKDESIRPDIFIGHRVQHFPWSLNSPYFHDYESWLKQPHV